jgi:uncharacterized repeat protein (TIGR01451 family)
MQIVKTRETPDDDVVAGADVEYTLTVTNLGPSCAEDVEVTEIIPVGSVGVSMTGCTNDAESPIPGTDVCQLSSIFAVDQSESITVQITAPICPPADATSMTNTAEVSSSTLDLNEVNNEDSETSHLNFQFDLVVEKTATGNFIPGDSDVTYQFNVRNKGPSCAHNTKLSDDIPGFPSGLSGGAYVGCLNVESAILGSDTCELGTLQPNAEDTIVTAELTIPLESDSCGSVTNMAAVSASPGTELVMEDNHDSVTNDLVPLADLSVVKTSPEEFVAGTSVEYTLTVVNDGPCVATGVVVTESLPAGLSGVYTGCTNDEVAGTSNQCAIADMAVGASTTITVVVDIPADATGSYVNSASVSGEEEDPNENNDQDDVTDEVTQESDVYVQKVLNEDSTLVAGADATYTITVWNLGPSVATFTELVDELPAGVDPTTLSFSGCDNDESASADVACQLGTLPVVTLDDDPNKTIFVTLMVPTTQRGDFTNTAIVSSGNEAPGASGNNQDIDTTRVTVDASISVVKTRVAPASGPLILGNDVEYRIDVTSNGPSAASNVNVMENIPSGTTIVSFSSECGDSTAETILVNGCDLGDMEPDTTVSFNVVINVPIGYPEATVRNVVVVSFDEEVDPENPVQDEEEDPIEEDGVECTCCEKPKKLSFIWQGTDSVDLTLTNHRGDITFGVEDGQSLSNVENGQELTAVAPGDCYSKPKGNFGPWLIVTASNGEEARIHTSCSVALGRGLDVGNALVTAAETCDGRSLGHVQFQIDYCGATLNGGDDDDDHPEEPQQDNDDDDDLNDDHPEEPQQDNDDDHDDDDDDDNNRRRRSDRDDDDDGDDKDGDDDHDDDSVQQDGDDDDDDDREGNTIDSDYIDYVCTPVDGDDDDDDDRDDDHSEEQDNDDDRDDDDDDDNPQESQEDNDDDRDDDRDDDAVDNQRRSRGKGKRRGRMARF